MLLVDEGVGLVVCELAVLMIGAAFVPVDPNWPPQRQVPLSTRSILLTPKP